MLSEIGKYSPWSPQFQGFCTWPAGCKYLQAPAKQFLIAVPMHYKKKKKSTTTTTNHIVMTRITRYCWSSRKIKNGSLVVIKRASLNCLITNKTKFYINCDVFCC